MTASCVQRELGDCTSRRTPSRTRLHSGLGLRQARKRTVDMLVVTYNCLIAAAAVETAAASAAAIQNIAVDKLRSRLRSNRQAFLYGKPPAGVAVPRI